MSSDCYKIMFVLPFMCFVFFGIIYTPITVLEYLENEKYNETNCTSTSIIYPTSYDNDSHWGVCSCRKRCKAHSPVISVFVSIENTNDTFLLNQNYIKDDYTFYNQSCPDGNTPGYTRTFLSDAEAIFEEYQNKTFKCYFNEEKNHVCLTKIETIWTYGNYVIWGLCGALFLCCFCHGCCNYKTIFTCK